MNQTHAYKRRHNRNEVAGQRQVPIAKLMGSTSDEERPDVIVIREDPMTRAEVSAVDDELVRAESELYEDLRTAMDRFSERERELFVDRALRKMTYRGLAKKHEMSVAGAYNTYQRLRGILAARLDGPFRDVEFMRRVRAGLRS